MLREMEIYLFLLLFICVFVEVSFKRMSCNQILQIFQILLQCVVFLINSYIL